MSKQKNRSNTVETYLAEKEGHISRRFTLQQLEAMGQDPGGKSYDGWVLVDDIQIPEEVSGRKRMTLEEFEHFKNINPDNIQVNSEHGFISGDSSDPEFSNEELLQLSLSQHEKLIDQEGQISDLTQKVEELETKLKAEKAKAKAAKQATKTENSDATTGKTESTGGSDDIGTKRTGSEDSTQGSTGDGEAD